jgi:hypothetical protein
MQDLRKQRQAGVCAIDQLVYKGCPNPAPVYSMPLFQLSFAWFNELKVLYPCSTIVTSRLETIELVYC